VPLNLGQLVEKLNGYTQRVPLVELEQWLSDLELQEGELEQYYCFSAGHYTRNPIAVGPAYQALILCWLPGQESVIHDHVGSSCAVRILHGACTEVVFNWQPDGSLAESHSCTLPEGRICGTQDADIHMIANYTPDKLITLHIYSPPLEVMNTYKLNGEKAGEVHVPVQAPTSPLLTLRPQA
jgi:cysteine dioxygenase